MNKTQEKKKRCGRAEDSTRRHARRCAAQRPVLVSVSREVSLSGIFPRGGERMGLHAACRPGSARKRPPTHLGESTVSVGT